MTVTLRHLVVDELPEGGAVLVGHDAQGVEYSHERVLSRFAADRLAEKVHAAGLVINPDHWYARVPYGSDAYVALGEEETLILAERYYGLGEGAELAHVV